MPDFDPLLSQPPYVHNTFQVSDMLVSAYRKAQALKHPGQGISNSESAEGLNLLNSMVDGWKIEGLLIEYMLRSLQSMVPNQKVYGVGPGQDFNLERPEKIPRASRIVGVSPNTAEIKMEIVETFERWQTEFVVKETTSDVPLALYYQASVPYGAANIWPVPRVVSQIAIYTPNTLSEFSTVDDVVEMPKGFREMLEYGLAVCVHEVYPDRMMDPKVATKAEVYKTRVKNSQMKPIFVGSDPAVMQERRNSSPAGNPRTWTPY